MPKAKDELKVRLQKQKAYKYKDKTQFKHVIVVPEDAVNSLGWIGGEELNIKVSDGCLTVKSQKNAKTTNLSIEANTNQETNQGNGAQE